MKVPCKNFNDGALKCTLNTRTFLHSDSDMVLIMHFETHLKEQISITISDFETVFPKFEKLFPQHDLKWSWHAILRSKDTYLVTWIRLP